MLGVQGRLERLQGLNSHGRYFLGDPRAMLHSHRMMVVGTEEFVDPRKVDGEIPVDRRLLRGVMPVVIAGHHEVRFTSVSSNQCEREPAIQSSALEEW